MADKRHPSTEWNGRGKLVGELISIRRGAIRGNPLPVSGPPLDSVISPGCVCSIDKLSRACCTRAGACAFQRGVRAAGARTRPHKANTFLVYFPTISPQSSPCNPRLFSCSVSAEEERQQPRLDDGGWRNRQLPFRMWRLSGHLPSLAFDFLVITPGLLLLAIVVRPWNQVWK